jgi:glycosyltransferase involved in cell wall biosynthesis
MEGFLYRHFDLNMANSEDNKKYIISRGGPPEKVMAVYHWVNTEEIKPGPRGNSIRKKLNLKNEFIVSFAGLMGVSQDLDTVLEAAGLLRDYQEITFLLVGDGVEKPRLERIAQKADLANVHFLPMLPKQEYPLVLAASDLCLATLRSTLRTPVVPSKIMSIMSAGRPVLGSFHLGGEASRLIEASQGGISVPPENPQEMTKAILTLYHDKKLAKTMGNNGRRYVERHYSMNVSVAKIEKLFATIFANRKPAHH